MKFKNSLLILSSVFAISCLQSGDKSSSVKSPFAFPESQSGKPFATIGDQKINEGFFDFLISINPRLKDRLAIPKAKKELANQIVEQSVFYKEALARGLQNDADIQKRMSLMYMNILGQKVLTDELESKMKIAYEEQKDQKFTKKEISQIAIFFQTHEDRRAKKPITKEDKAKALAKIKAIKKDLDAGKNFEKLAAEFSDDRRTKKRGGKAGQVSKNGKRYARMGLKEVATKAFELKKGDVSDPIETKMGYYLIKVDSDLIVTPFEKAKRALGFDLQKKVRSELYDSLKTKYKVKIEDAYKKEIKSKAKAKAINTIQMPKGKTKLTQDQLQKMIQQAQKKAKNKTLEKQKK